MKNEKIIRPYYDDDNELRIGVFENTQAKEPISSTTKHIELDELEEILRNIEAYESQKPTDKRAKVNYKLQRKNNFVKSASLTLALIIAITSTGYGIIKLSQTLLKNKKTSKDNTKIENAIDNQLVTDNNYTIDQTLSNDNLVTIEDKLKEFTNEEKLQFIKNNIENFKNDIALSTGITLNNTEALIQLGFINCLTPQEINVTTDNYWLDFANDYNAILDEITVPTINYLSFGHNLKGNNPSDATSIYAKYILDEKDQKIYSFYADRMQSIISGSYEKEKEKENILNESYDFTRAIAETIVYPNNPIQKDNVKNYQKVRQELIKELNKIPSYEELANKLNLTINQVKELEVASLGTTTASNEIYFITTLLAQKSVQLLPEDTVIEYTDTLGEIDNSIMNYNSHQGKPNYPKEGENYEHDKYLMLDIEYFNEKAISILLADYEEKGTLCNEAKKVQTETSTKNCSVSRNYNPNKSYVRKLTNYNNMVKYL